MVRSTLSCPQKDHILEGRAVAALCQGRLAWWSCPRCWIGCSRPDGACRAAPRHLPRRDWRDRTGQMDTERQADRRGEQMDVLIRDKGRQERKGQSICCKHAEPVVRLKRSNWQTLNICTATVCCGCNRHHQCFRITCSLWPKGGTIINITTLGLTFKQRTVVRETYSILYCP